MTFVQCHFRRNAKDVSIDIPTTSPPNSTRTDRQLAVVVSAVVE